MEHCKNIAILSPLVFLFSLSLDIYSPTIPELMKAFHTNSSVIQMTISLFVIVMGFGQLLIGPFSDRIGRKPVIIVGLVIFILASILCAKAPTPAVLIAGRILQAAGCAATMSSAFASTRDIYKQEAAHVYSLLNSTIAIVPLIAPILGSILATNFGWESNFVFLAICGLLILIMSVTTFKESLEKKVRHRILTRENLSIACHPEFIIFALVSAFGMSCFLAFFSIAPYIIINLLHTSVEHFGLYFSTISIFGFFGSLTASKLILKKGVKWVALVGACIVLFSGILMTIIFWLNGLSVLGYLVPSLIMGAGASFLLGASAGGAITPFENAGFASSLLGCTQFVLGSLIVSILTIWPISSPLPTAALIIVAGGLSLVLVSILPLINKTLATKMATKTR